MKYTVRYCHMAFPTNLRIGQKIKSGDTIGKMGSTGQSTAAHLHLDCVHGEIAEPWRLSDMENQKVVPAFRQINYFIDSGLFLVEPVITSYYNDPNYKDSAGRNIVHLAYDLVPINRHQTMNNYDIYWNRTKTGRLIAKGYDEGYGYYAHISYEA